MVETRIEIRKRYAATLSRPAKILAARVVGQWPGTARVHPFGHQEQAGLERRVPRDGDHVRAPRLEVLRHRPERSADALADPIHLSWHLSPELVDYGEVRGIDAALAAFVDEMVLSSGWPGREESGRTAAATFFWLLLPATTLPAAPASYTN